ncbi:hypothetical protein N0V93_006393 [Gnomoniopsis smithogilvyi]|uniref:Epoxide hydrolase N-terminal domain-containing protein n=1 Tax=Gnomoniopsis smithogilvyi TaxID=1191159 RepID=A0A9W8YQP5_9PEZI|nr:hypothetical protein N0V93_006393 [Gnomoniopsis smithogilvyi]
MAATVDTAGAAVGDEIKPYKIRVSRRYIDLTKQKLELTRLPHEGKEPKSTDWWEPKPQVEPLVDFWLEKYSWRDQEETLNKTPQFRTAISIPGSETPPQAALHPRAKAIPLLLLPPFPFVNLALVHLIKSFTEPEDAVKDQPFHLVIPALPGLGFSDPFPNNTPEISTTAEMLNSLMIRLDYQHYLVSNTGAAKSSPAEIDWKLVDRLSVHYPTSCVGAHFIAPPLVAPKLTEAPLEWAKWTIANALSSGILGYSEQDFSALKQTAPSRSAKAKGLTPGKLGLNQVGLREPNTLAYAMCDSPTGLLVFAMKGLSLLTPRIQFTPEQIITFANLAWLPGPEYAMRFWARCATNEEGSGKDKKPPVNKPKVAITVFLGGREEEEEEEATGDDTMAQEVGEGAIRLEAPLKVDTRARYTCPAWAKTHYNVLFTQRASGDPGLLAWERPELILTGIRGLVREVVKLDQRLEPARQQTAEPLASVVVADENGAQDGGLKPPERPSLGQGDSSRTRVGSPDGGLKAPGASQFGARG